MNAARLDLATANPTTIARTEVKAGERLLWADRAIKRKPTLGSLKIAAIGLVFASFGALWMLFTAGATAGTDDLWRFFPLFGTPFVLIGLGIATAPFWLPLVGGPTIYGLTESRVFMMSGRNSVVVRSTPLSAIRQLIMNERPDGTGDLNFGGVMSAPANERLHLITGLYGIENVRRVRTLMEREMERVEAAENASAKARGEGAA